MVNILNLFLKKPAKSKTNQLLPPSTDKSKLTLVLDMDETLIHSSFVNINEEPTTNKTYDTSIKMKCREFTCYGQCRPHLEEFLEQMSQHYELVCFTASDQCYADPILDIIDPKRTIKHRLYRDSCYMICGAYVKDLRCLGRPLERTIILDNNLWSFVFQMDNGIHIKTWKGDEKDQELKQVGKFLKNLAITIEKNSAEDTKDVEEKDTEEDTEEDTKDTQSTINVQQILRQKFKLSDKLFGLNKQNQINKIK